MEAHHLSLQFLRLPPAPPTQQQPEQLQRQPNKQQQAQTHPWQPQVGPTPGHGQGISPPKSLPFSPANHRDNCNTSANSSVPFGQTPPAPPAFLGLGTLSIGLETPPRATTTRARVTDTESLFPHPDASTRSLFPAPQLTTVPGGPGDDQHSSRLLPEAQHFARPNFSAMSPPPYSGVYQHSTIPFQLAPAPETPPHTCQHPSGSLSASSSGPCLNLPPPEAGYAAKELALGPTALQLEAAARIVVREESPPPSYGLQPLENPGPGRCAFGTHRKKQGLDRKDLPEDGYSWHKYGHKTLMGLFSRAYYRCTHRTSGCRAKKTVDTALKGSNEVRITYDGTHTHAPEREVMDGVVVSTIGRQSRESSTEREKCPLAGQGGEVAGPLHLQYELQQEQHHQVAFLGVRKREGGVVHSAAPSIELRCRKQRRVLMVDEASAAAPCSTDGGVRKFVVVQDDGPQWVAPANVGGMVSFSGQWEDAPSGQVCSPRSDDSAVIEQSTPPQHSQTGQAFEDQFEVASFSHETGFRAFAKTVAPPRLQHSLGPMRKDGLDLELRL